MPDPIESRTFRAAARINCVKYLDIPIYVGNIPDLQKLALPSFKAQSTDGAVAQLFSTLVNMNTQIEQIRKGLRMSDSKPVPGVSYDDIESMSMSLTGDVYFENAAQYRTFNETIRSIAKNYGWIENVSGEMGTAVYHPAKNDYVNSDPIQAAIKGMVLGAASQAGDEITIATTGNVEKGSAAERRYFAARDRSSGSSIFDMAALQYYSNTPTTVQNNWATLDDRMVPTLLIDNAPVFKANIPYMPTGVTVTPGAYVVDATVLYPTKCAISIQMSNPLGGLFANFSVAEEGAAGAGDSAKALTPRVYLKDHSSR